MASNGKPLPKSFFMSDTVEVSQRLLGQLLVRTYNNTLLVGIIVETEAYRSDDPASHAYRGLTARNKSMFGQVGHAYVYISYGLHYCVNIVARDIDNYEAGGVLIRSVIPIAGIEQMIKNRKTAERAILTNGPGKVGQAFYITKEQDGVDITNKQSPLYIAQGYTVPVDCIEATPRIGISVAQDKLWRFLVSKRCRALFSEDL